MPTFLDNHFTSRGQKRVTLCVCARLESEVSGVYLQSPCCGRVGLERDSGYDSLRRRMSVLDRLTQTHPVWLLLAVSEQEAIHILLKQPPGVRSYHPTHVQTLIHIYYLGLYYILMACDSTAQVFLVRKSAALQRKVLSVRVREDESGAAISHFPVRENQYSKYHVSWGYVH